jgi:hypothetical protein
VPDEMDTGEHHGHEAAQLADAGHMAHAAAAFTLTAGFRPGVSSAGHPWTRLFALVDVAYLQASGLVNRRA